jgi:hypothetical protein
VQNFEFNIASRLKQIQAAKKPIDKFEVIYRDAVAAISSKMSLFDLAETILALGSEGADAVECLRKIRIGDILQGAAPKPAVAKKAPRKPRQADPKIVAAIMEAVENGPISQSDVRTLLDEVGESQFRAAWDAAKQNLQKVGSGRATMWQMIDAAAEVVGLKNKKAS